MVKFTKLIPSSIKSYMRARLEKIEMAQTYEVVIDPGRRPLAGQKAIVTGASGAIGRAISLLLAAQGAHVIAVARDAVKLNQLVFEAEELGFTMSFETVDLFAPEDIKRLATAHPDVEILVNNAGGSSRGRSAAIWEQRAEVIDEVLNINLRAKMLTAAACGGEMVRRGMGGRIINIGSTVGTGGLANFTEYAASKAGVAGFTRSAALEFGPHGVTVNCVSPGIVQRGQITRRKADLTLGKSILPRLGRAEDIASMVAFLAGPGGEWVTGQEILVDGGRALGLHGE